MKNLFKILIVDDTEVNREFLKTLIETRESSYEYIIIEAEDGNEAIKILKDTPQIDLVILDMMMPVYDGFYFLDNFKSITGEKYLPVIVMSAVGDTKVVSKAFEYGIYDYFIKPLSTDQILSFELKIKNALGMKTFQDELRLRNKIMENEILLASKMQRRFLPKYIDNQNFSLSYYFAPYSGLSGDYLDYFKIDSDNLLIVLADVVGHGAASAILSAMIKMHTNDFILNNAEDFSIEKFVMSINAELLKLDVDEVIVTAFIGLYNLKTKNFKYVIAGHPYPVLMNSITKQIEFIETGACLPMGIFKDLKPEHNSFDMKSGDTLIIYTDGIMEAKTENNEYFGLNNIKLYSENFAKNNKEFNSESYVKMLLKDLTHIKDDLSIIFLTVK